MHVPEQSLELYSSTAGECSVVPRLLSKWSEIIGGENTGKEGATSDSCPGPVARFRNINDREGQLGTYELHV